MREHMIKTFFILIMLCNIFLTSLSFSQVIGVSYDWRKTVDKEGIQVFSSKVQNSKFRAVRAQMMIRGEISNLVALFEDTENCSNWASLCKEVSLVKTIANDGYFVYVLNAVTFPVADRDLIMKITWHKDVTTGKLTMNSQAVENYQGVPKKNGVVRINYAITQWHFTPQPNGYVLVESFTHVDPNGAAPAWIVNTMSKNAPFRSMKKIRKIIQSGKYNNATLNLPAHYL